MRKLSDILKEWDANRSQRQNLLTEFLAMTEDKTAIDLANALGHHTSLLFARFIAALRLNYNNQGVGLLLDAINRFTGATGGTFDVLEHDLYVRTKNRPNLTVTLPLVSKLKNSYSPIN